MGDHAAAAVSAEDVGPQPMALSPAAHGQIVPSAPPGTDAKTMNDQLQTTDAEMTAPPQEPSRAEHERVLRTAEASTAPFRSPMTNLMSERSRSPVIQRKLEDDFAASVTPAPGTQKQNDDMTVQSDRHDTKAQQEQQCL